MPFLVIAHNNKERWIYMNWLGMQDLETVNTGTQALVKFLKKTKCRKVLADNRGILQMWEGAGEWGRPQNFNLIAEAGCRYLAFITSPNPFNRLATEEMVRNATSLSAATFEQLADAADWLRSKPT